MFHGRLSQQTKRQICSLMNSKKPKIVVNALPLQQQNNGVDCSLFAIAFVQFVMHYEKYPINITFKQSLMRNHAMEALKKNKLELFPVIKCIPIEPVKVCKSMPFELEIYCHCRMIWSPYDKQIHGKKEQQHLIRDFLKRKPLLKSMA